LPCTAEAVIPMKERLKTISRTTACISLVLILYTGMPLAQQDTTSYIGLYVDDSHTCCGVSVCTGNYEPFDLYVWIKPGEHGMMSAEFAIDYPYNVAYLEVETNPIVESFTGTLVDGISAHFYDCQTDWVWLFKQRCMLFDNGDSPISPVPHPDRSTLLCTSCLEGNPEEECYNCQDVNTFGYCLGAPEIQDVYVSDPQLLEVELDWALGGEWEVFERDDPAITIPIDSVTVWQDQSHRRVYLAQPISPNLMYILAVRNVYNETNGICQKYDTYEFFFTLVSSQLAGFSAVSNGSGIEIIWELSDPAGDLDFMIYRAVGDADSFEPVDSPVIERHGSEFSYIDNSCDPGVSYRYRVGYLSNGEHFHLFETGQVTTPAAKCWICQNYPNPFNPVTTIVYNLPAAARIELDVFDVSGRHITRLAEGEKPAGKHSVDWPGLDDHGRAVSAGIYLYRLSAGKEIITKKMLLLR